MSNLQHERITTLAAELRLLAVPDLYGPIAQTAATRKDASYADFLEDVLRSERDARHIRSRELITRMAGFPALKSLDGYDFAFATGAPRQQIQELAALSHRIEHYASDYSKHLLLIESTQDSVQHILGDLRAMCSDLQHALIVNEIGLAAALQRQADHLADEATLQIRLGVVVRQRQELKRVRVFQRFEGKVRLSGWQDLVEIRDRFSFSTVDVRFNLMFEDRSRPTEFSRGPGVPEPGSRVFDFENDFHVVPPGDCKHIPRRFDFSHSL